MIRPARRANPARRAAGHAPPERAEPLEAPGGGLAAALTHDVIHGQDITVVLGIEHLIPEERLRIVLQTITSPKSLKHFGADLLAEG